jgi:hypothetical protein
MEGLLVEQEVKSFRMSWACQPGQGNTGNTGLTNQTVVAFMHYRQQIA